MTDINLSWLEDFVPIDTFKDDNQSHTAISEFTSGSEQAASLWDRSKKAYELSVYFDRNSQDQIDALLWTKAALRGKAGRVWVPNPIAELFHEEYFGTGDGVQKSFVLPTFGPFSETGYPKIYDAGAWLDVGGREGTANEVSKDLGRALNENLWIPTNCSAFEELNYQWQYNQRCTEVEVGSTGAVAIEAAQAERVQKAWPTGMNVYTTVALRGDVAQDMKVGGHFYDSGGGSLGVQYGTAAPIKVGAWTLISALMTIPASFHEVAVVVGSEGALDGSDVFYVGGVALNIYGPGWWDPVTNPNVIQFPTAPVLGNRLSFSGRARNMRKMRLAADNINHAINTMGHVNMARLKMLEVVE